MIMSWFRKKGKYWYFVERIIGKELQYYIGDDNAVKNKLAQTNNKLLVWKKIDGKHKCMACGTCIASCPQEALSFNKSDDEIIIKHSKCLRCGLCVNVCTEAVLNITDKKLLPKQSKKELNKKC